MKMKKSIREFFTEKEWAVLLEYEEELCEKVKGLPEYYEVDVERKGENDEGFDN